MTEALRYISEAKLDQLRESVAQNADRYLSTGFEDLVLENGWGIELGQVQVNKSLLATLDVEAGPKGDGKNSRIVYEALVGMTPSLAREERIWTRLAHVECMAYSRARWLAGEEGDALVKTIHSHMFGRGLTGVRDDNAIGRLWWNYHIATIAHPEDPDNALSKFTRTADFRLSFVERTGTVMRRPLAQAIIRGMNDHPVLTNSEASFRTFMKAINREGGGLLFEAVSGDVADDLVKRCAKEVEPGAGGVV